MTRSASDFDVAIVGGGPSGSSCAAFCARAGLRTVVLERAIFPREKVCGDCLNPIAWPVLRRLDLESQVRSLPHARLGSVEFVGCNDRRFVVDLPFSAEGEIAIKRSLLDLLLLDRARELGAETLMQSTVVGVKQIQGLWKVETSEGSITCRTLVAADGRNSTVARLLGLQPSTKRDRIGLQTHIPRPAEMTERVRMQFVPDGYTGLADIGEKQANLCLVARPENIKRLQRWAMDRYQLPSEQQWRAITPLSRPALPPVQGRLLLVGDAARVVEPFTGEGISYALASGELAAEALITNDLPSYHRAHDRLYHGRLWINHLAKAACLRPDLATAFLDFARFFPRLLSLLTHKVVNPPNRKLPFKG